MDDRIRISDADRDRAAARLRDHYAEGRLTADELDERVTAALSARTAGDLRRLMADLPGEQVRLGAPRMPPAPPAWAVRPRGPRVLPLLLLVLLAAVLLPGGWVFFAFLKVALLFWLIVALAGMVAVARFRRRMRRALRDRDHDRVAAGSWGDWEWPGWPGRQRFRRWDR